MEKNKIVLMTIVIAALLAVTACGIEKVSKKKTNDVDFTVVAESEIPSEVSQIVEERKETPFKVTYSDNEYTYIIVGYGKQKYEGYSIRVKSLYETKNSICVKTEFKGPEEYSNTEIDSYPYIVIKIEYTNKNVVFSE
ncbi:MAG: protease complex subunit PrcB family protein [Eubacterium sp.]